MKHVHVHTASLAHGHIWCVALASACLSSHAFGEICAGWSFNTFRTGDYVEYSTIGDGVLLLDDQQSIWDPLQGTSLNAWRDWSAGSALGIRGEAANGSSFTIQHPVQSFSSAEFTFAMRRSATGFQTIHIDYLTETGWIKLGNASLESEWSVARFRIPGAIGVLDNLSLRMTIEGATSSQGTARFDNMILNLVDIPAPGGWPLLCVAAQLISRRRENCVVLPVK